MNIGSIYLHSQFKFNDGETGKKYFILLNSLDSEYSQQILKNKVLICKTTSKENKYRKIIPGCNKEYNNFMLPANKDWFPSNTWIQFDLIYELEVNAMLQDRFKGNLKYIGSLKKENYNALINCILTSDDVPLYQLEILKLSKKTYNQQ